MTKLTYFALHGLKALSFEKPETVLDLVRKLLAYFETRGRTRSAKPSLIPGLDKCLANYTEGTYQHWVVAQAVDRIKESHQNRTEEYEKRRCRTRVRNNKTAKSVMGALKDRISGLRRLEKKLVSKGAKTFAE